MNRKSCLVTLLVTTAMFVTGCTPPPPPAEGLDVTGSCVMKVTGIADCDEAGIVSTETWNVTQNGSAITAVFAAGSLTGTLSGRTVNLSGSFPEDGRTTTVSSTSLTVLADGNSLSGTATFTWTDGAESCGGTGSVTGTKGG